MNSSKNFEPPCFRFLKVFMIKLFFQSSKRKSVFRTVFTHRYTLKHIHTPEWVRGKYSRSSVCLSLSLSLSLSLPLSLSFSLFILVFSSRWLANATVCYCVFAVTPNQIRKKQRFFYCFEEKKGNQYFNLYSFVFESLTNFVTLSDILWHPFYPWHSLKWEKNDSVNAV